MIAAASFPTDLSVLSANGFCIVAEVFKQSEVAALCRLLESGEKAPSAGRRLFGEEWHAVRDTALSGRLLEIMSSALASVGKTEVRCIRATIFDKTPEANWKVPWHQDLTIPVDQRPDTELPGYGPWTIKDGIPHVQPPVSVLRHMLAARIHLDLCGADNGALRVLPGSHEAGRLSSDSIQQWRRNKPETICVSGAGDVLLMRPLLLHASSPAAHPARRRVLHLEFAACDLAAPLRWRRF